MNTKRFKLLVCLFLFSSQVFGQQNFLAGLARQSLQPGKESFSLALAGYGAPRDGRFTLDWEQKANLAPGSVLTGTDAVFLAISAKDILQQAPVNRFPLQWTTIGRARAAKSLTGDNDNLYLLNTVGNKIYHKSSSGKKWEKAGAALALKEIVLAGNNLFGLGTDGSFKKAVPDEKKLQWQTVTHLPGAVSFVVHRQSIYAATGTDTLYRYNLNQVPGRWIKAGYYNQVIQNVKVQKLLVANDKLYSLDEKGNLYEATKIYGDKPDELFATALAIKQVNQTVVLLGVDLCGFDDSMVKEIKAELTRKRGLPAAAVLINASHTHFAPVTQLWATWGPQNQVPDSSYLNLVVKPAILKAAEKALDNLAPADIYFGRGKTAIGRNRSNKNLETPYDDDVDVLKVESKDGKNNYVLVLAGCHPVFVKPGRQNYTISSNYPGYMRDMLERSQKNTTALFIQGCAGDINPRDNQPDVTGHKLAQDAMQVLNHKMTFLQGGISFYMDTLQAPATPWSREKIVAFRQENLKEPGNIDMEKNVRWADLMLQKLDKGTMPNHMPVYIQTINIGNWKMVGLSREVVTEYSLGIKAIWPDKLVSVAGYCNDVASYLPVERHIRTGVYEGYNSFLWYGQPSAFPENILDLVLDKVRAGNY
ncbi:hypothetical protein AAE02nite_24320 [Adhaeribacter aerolatus]|uniref:Neutral/alkaline non-lysosomal ceramidase N-terminal domain-containing protein n=1 Tax=Adhaeribacter aerolatus TaxID=670289 RepID=A0A512AYH8_9BACT|nr:hypothetical protein [Adhaeribacter aerolatus]GEO04768.1 hypothetical protein AAE02nite_24320 [Adhaeribacter aerolatus]